MTGPSAKGPWLRAACLLMLLLSQCHGRSLQQQNATAANTECLARAQRDLRDQYNNQTGTSTCPELELEGISARILACIGATSSALRTLKILSPIQNAASLPVYAEAFLKATGFRLNFEFLQIPELAGAVLESVQRGWQIYDGWILDPITIADLAHYGVLEKLDPYIRNDGQLDWQDQESYFQDVSSVYNNSIVGLPLAGKVSILYYRKDVLHAFNITPPATWDDLLAAAAVINGTDMNGDKSPDYAICWQAGPYCIEDSIIISQILAAMTQATGLISGWLFDGSDATKGVQPLVNNAAMIKALNTFRQLQQLTWPHNPPPYSDCELLHIRFITGECALTIKWDEQFKGIQQVARPLWGGVGFARVPGSRQVLDRTTGQLVPCTNLTVCPMAIPAAPLAGSPSDTPTLVNYAPHFGFGGFSGYINAQGDPAYKQAVYDFFSTLAAPGSSFKEVLKLGPVGPFRKSHLSTSAANLAEWAAAGYNPADVVEMLTVTKTQLASKNIALDLRILSGNTYRTLLSSIAQAAAAAPDASAIPAIAANAAVQFQAALNASGPPDVVLASYDAGLGVVRMSRPVSQPTDSKAPLSGGSIAAVVVGATLGCVVLSTCLIFLINRGKRRTLFGRTVAPKLGPSSTILVTDVESSTLMWEVLPQEAMNRAVEVHHALIRKLLRRHHGYESSTEGDSFIIAFHAPAEALLFSQALQAQLLLQDWPQELLDHKYGRPIYAAKVSKGSGLEDVGVRAHSMFFRRAFTRHSASQGTEARVVAHGSGRNMEDAVASPAGPSNNAMAGVTERVRAVTDGALSPVPELGAEASQSPSNAGLRFSTPMLMTANVLSSMDSPTHMGLEALMAAGASVDAALAHHGPSNLGPSVLGMELGAGGARGLSTSQLDSTHSGTVKRLCDTATGNSLSMAALALLDDPAYAAGARRSNATASLIRVGSQNVQASLLARALASNTGTVTLNVSSTQQSVTPQVTPTVSSTQQPLPPTSFEPRSAEAQETPPAPEIQPPPTKSPMPRMARFADQLAALEVQVAAQELDGDRGLMTKLDVQGQVKISAHTAREFYESEWDVVQDGEATPADAEVVLVYRGLRVRVGFHSGIRDASECIVNKTTGRMAYFGLPVSLAKAVADCGHGGMVLCSQAAFERLPLDALSSRTYGMLINMGDYVFVKEHTLPATSVYQALSDSLVARAGLSAPLLRGTEQLQAGVLDAPLGDVTIVFSSIVGASTLLSWNHTLASQALDTFEMHAVRLLSGRASGGYLVELSGGFCLAAFHRPSHALVWGLSVVADLKMADWAEEILAHELCEEVVVAGSGAATSFAASSQHRTALHPRPSALQAAGRQGSVQGVIDRITTGTAAGRPSSVSAASQAAHRLSVGLGPSRLPPAPMASTLTSRVPVLPRVAQSTCQIGLGIHQDGVDAVPVSHDSTKTDATARSGPQAVAGSAHTSARVVGHDTLRSEGALVAAALSAEVAATRSSGGGGGSKPSSGPDTLPQKGASQQMLQMPAPSSVSGTTVSQLGMVSTMATYSSQDSRLSRAGSGRQSQNAQLGDVRLTPQMMQAPGMGVLAGGEPGSGFSLSCGSGIPAPSSAVFEFHALEPHCNALQTIPGSESPTMSSDLQQQVEPNHQSITIMARTDSALSVHTSSVRAGMPPGPALARVLFRGPRLKVGIDVGRVHADVNPVTGRMQYRGRVMNRAARISQKAGSGQVWCTENVWKWTVQHDQELVTTRGLDGKALGHFNLKGVSEPLSLVQCHMWRSAPSHASQSVNHGEATPSGTATAHANSPPWLSARTTPKGQGPSNVVAGAAPATGPGYAPAAVEGRHSPAIQNISSSGLPTEATSRASVHAHSLQALHSLQQRVSQAVLHDHVNSTRTSGAVRAHEPHHSGHSSAGRLRSRSLQLGERQGRMSSPGITHSTKSFLNRDDRSQAGSQMPHPGLSLQAERGHIGSGWPARGSASGLWSAALDEPNGIGRSSSASGVKISSAAAGAGRSMTHTMGAVHMPTRGHQAHPVWDGSAGVSSSRAYAHVHSATLTPLAEAASRSTGGSAGTTVALSIAQPSAMPASIAAHSLDALQPAMSPPTSGFLMGQNSHMTSIQDDVMGARVGSGIGVPQDPILSTGISSDLLFSVFGGAASNAAFMRVFQTDSEPPGRLQQLAASPDTPAMDSIAVSTVSPTSGVPDARSLPLARDMPHAAARSSVAPGQVGSHSAATQVARMAGTSWRSSTHTTTGHSMSSADRSDNNWGVQMGASGEVGPNAGTSAAAATSAGPQNATANLSFTSCTAGSTSHTASMSRPANQPARGLGPKFSIASALRLGGGASRPQNKQGRSNRTAPTRSSSFSHSKQQPKPAHSVSGFFAVHDLPDHDESDEEGQDEAATFLGVALRN